MLFECRFISGIAKKMKTHSVRSATSGPVCTCLHAFLFCIYSFSVSSCTALQWNLSPPAYDAAPLNQPQTLYATVHLDFFPASTQLHSSTQFFFCHSGYALYSARFVPHMSRCRLHFLSRALSSTTSCLLMQRITANQVGRFGKHPPNALREISH